MAGFVLSEADRARVSAAVAAAETGTDGEIVTIMAPRSDDYLDIRWGGVALALLAVTCAAVAFPWLLDAPLAWIDPWEVPGLVQRLAVLLAAQLLVAIIVALVLAGTAARIAVALPGTRTRRVARRAQLYFKLAADQRTAARTGVLLYLSLAERRAEIVADEAIHAKVTPETWGAAMAALIDAVRDGRPGDGLVAAVAAIGAVMATHCPKTADDTNELPDRLIEL